MSPETMLKPGNVVEMAMRQETLSIFVKALALTGLQERLSHRRRFTVFAPDDDAFNAYAVMRAKNLFGNAEELNALVSYHIVPGKFVGSYFNRSSAVRTLLGAELVIDRSKFVDADIECSNGLIHIIDTVMVPGPGSFFPPGTDRMP